MLNNNSISLWDYPELGFELNFELKEVNKPQYRIVFSDIYNKFITLEKPDMIHIWDIDNAKHQEGVRITPEFKYPFKQTNKTSNPLKTLTKHEDSIHIFTEIKKLMYWVIITGRQTLIIYDLVKKSIILEKKIASSVITKLIYIEKHKAIIPISHNNKIPVFLFKNKKENLELTYLNYLIGHLSFIMDADLLKNKSILVSVDEQCVIKFWNLKTMTCVRTVNLEGKSAIRALFCMEDKNKIAIISRKINIYDTEHNICSLEDSEKDDIIDIFFNQEDNLIYIFKKLELLHINHKKGNIQAIYKYNKRNEFDTDKIIAEKVKTINNGRNVVVSDINGKIYILNMKMEIQYKLESHNTPILVIHNDLKNQLIITSCGRTIKVHKLVKTKSDRSYKVIRKITNMMKDDYKMRLIAIETDLNLILTSTCDETVYIIDYEFGRLYASIELEAGYKVRDIKMITEKGIVLLITENEWIIILEFNFDIFTSGLKCDFKIIEKIKIKRHKKEGYFVNSMMNQEKFTQTGNADDLNLVLSYSNGSIIMYKGNSFLSGISTKAKYHTKNSFNAMRSGHSNFMLDLNNLKSFQLNFKNEKKQSRKLNNIVMGFENKASGSCFSLINEFYPFDSKFIGFNILSHSELFINCWNGNQFRMIDERGNKLIDYDIHENFPKLWEFNFNTTCKAKDKVYEALQLITYINKKIVKGKSALTSIINTDAVIREYESLYVENPLQIRQNKRRECNLKKINKIASEMKLKLVKKIKPKENSKVNRTKSKED